MRANFKWAHMQFGMVIAKTAHVALYVLLFATPVLGIASRIWNPVAWNSLGIPLPHVPVPDRDFAHQTEGIHETFGHVLMYLAGAHAAIGLFHHFWQRDNTLRRMLPPAHAED